MAKIGDLVRRVLEYSFIPRGLAFREDEKVVEFTPNAVYGIAIDGLSGLYSGQPTLVDGMSGGQWLAREVKRTFVSATRYETLADIILLANERVQVRVLKEFPEDVAFLPGATFAATRITADDVSIISGGDCVAVWEYESGTIGGTLNQNRETDRILDRGLNEEMKNVLGEMQAKGTLPEFDELLKHPTYGAILDKRPLKLDDLSQEYIEKHIRPVMRRRQFTGEGPIAKSRRRNANNPDVPECYGLLNGDRRLEQCWQAKVLPRDGLRRLILCTDGTFTGEVYLDPDPLAIPRFLLGNYQVGGFDAIERAVEEFQAAKSKTSYVDRTEAAAIAFDF